MRGFEKRRGDISIRQPFIGDFQVRLLRAALLGATCLSSASAYAVGLNFSNLPTSIGPLFFSLPSATSSAATHVSGDGNTALGVSNFTVGGGQVPKGFVFSGTVGPVALPFPTVAGVEFLPDAAAVGFDVTQNGGLAVGYSTPSYNSGNPQRFIPTLWMIAGGAPTGATQTAAADRHR